MKVLYGAHVLAYPHHSFGIRGSMNVIVTVDYMKKYSLITVSCRLYIMLLD